MVFEDVEIMTNILYFIREKYYHHAMGYVNDGIKRYGNEPCLKLLNAICLIFEDRLIEAIRELEMLTDKPDITIGVYLALATAYKRAKKPDQQDCENKVRELRKAPTDLGFYFAGMTLFLFDRHEKAREYLSRALKITTYPKETMNLLGWVDIMSSKEANQKKAERFFNDANERHANGQNLDSMLGKVKCLEVQGQHKAALDTASQLIVSNPRFLPGLLEKMRLQLLIGGWDEAYDTASRCLIIDSGCVEALKYQILKVLCLDGHYEEMSTKIGELLHMMDRHEPKNAFQYHRSANLFARICGRNHFVLQQCVFLQERAMQLAPDNADYSNGMGNLLLLQNKPRDAIKYFKATLTMEETNLAAIQGVIACQLIEGMLKEAATQLEFLNEVQSNIDKSAELKYLTAVIRRKHNESQAGILKCLDESIQIHFSCISNMQLSTDYIYLLNPDFLIQIVLEYVHFSPQSADQSTAAAGSDNSVLKRVVQILEQIVRFLPGLQQAGFLLARSHFQAGSLDKSRQLLEQCLQADQAFSAGHILMAQIHLQSGNHKLADHALEVGLSHNFQVRESALFHLIKGRILLGQDGKAAEAKKTLQFAMQLPGVRKPAANSSGGIVLSPADRLSVYLELAEALRQLGENHEAAKVLQDAQTDFAGTQQEARIVIRNAELALQRGDAEAALTMLRAVTPDHPFFLEARKAMAAVYLNHRRDRRLYAACFRELVDRQKTPETLSLLGDAYMELEQPEKAIAAYEEARQMAPEDGGNMELVAKLGGALVRTHNFSEAVKYYRRLVKAGGAAPGLRHRLCELLLSLRLYDDAKATLLKGLADIGKSSDYASVGEAVQLHLLLADVFHSQDEPEKEINQLTEARDLQVKVLRKVGIESPDNVVDEKRIATEISVRLAKWYSASGPENMSKAVRMFEEARSHNEADPETLLELARLHMRMGDVDSCQQHCLSLLRLQDERSSISVAGRTPVPPAVDTFAGQATLMMAELMLQKLDFDTALFHLKKLLAKEPNNYKALAVIVEVLRRNGELENILPYFKTIVDADSNATASAGYNFCKGLHEWYINNNAEALRLLNMARADSEWELQATHLMAEICLNPDNETLGGELLGELDQSAAAAAGDDLGAQPQRPEDKSSSATGNLRTAENLLKDLVDADARTVYLQHMVLVSSKHKGQLEKAMTHFTDIIKRDPNNVLANFGAAVACLVGKQSTKSKTYLSTVVSHPWTLEFAEEFERAWLLLADYHIQNKNTTGAADHLRNCIKYNKSCYSAHEYMGLISEKEQQYREAAAHYHSAWICSHKTNPAIGFKLAFNFLKVQKYVESIEVCLDVLKMNPKYPKIRKEILDKARMCVRV